MKRGGREASFGKQRGEKCRRDSGVPCLVLFQKWKEVKDTPSRGRPRNLSVSVAHGDLHSNLPNADWPIISVVAYHWQIYTYWSTFYPMNDSGGWFNNKVLPLAVDRKPTNIGCS